MDKAKHDITHWAVYNRAFVSRGSLTFWMDEAAITSGNGAMSRYKQLISPKLSLSQVAEALAGVKVMNKMLGLGMPVRQVN